MIDQAEREIAVIRGLREMRAAGVIGGIYVNGNRLSVQWDQPTVCTYGLDSKLERITWDSAERMIADWRRGIIPEPFTGGRMAPRVKRPRAANKTLLMRERKPDQEQSDRRREYAEETGKIA